MKRMTPFLLFLALWGFHLCSAGGTVVPYRDTGEMVVNSHTLGVAHPPGYPLYTLLGKAVQQIPLGNPAYRVNLLSALSSAGVGVCLWFLLVAGGWGGMAWVAVGLWASSPVFWELSSVSEMYAPALLGMLGILLLARRCGESPSPRLWLAMAFVMGLACGVRTDFVLLGPALLYWYGVNRPRVPLWALAAFGLLGLSVFLYLPVRSAQQPWVDWNNPEVLGNFMNSLLRRTHGGTLDLLSKSYGAGVNFVSEMGLFLRGAGGAFTAAGSLLAALGFWVLARRHRRWFIFIAINFVVFGPLFIYLANMPPNPHAVAIVEAHYLLPLLMGLLGLGAGLSVLWERAGGFLARLLLAVGGAALVVLNVAAHGGRGVKRWNMSAQDYLTNILRTSVPLSVGVLREDVPLFAAWERSLVRKEREDVFVVAQGLAASPWYHEMVRHQGRSLDFLGPLRDAGQWKAFRDRSRPLPLWIGGDVDFLGPRAELVPWGVVSYWPPLAVAHRMAMERTRPLWDFYVIRGVRQKVDAPDFFTSDLLSEYAAGALRQTTRFLKEKRWETTRQYLRLARSFDKESPSVPYNMGYVAMQRGQNELALRYYRESSRLYDRMFEKARFYKTLPDVVQGLKREAAEVWVHRGVASEREGDIEEARRCYAQALRLNPGSAQAHYNWGVTYWNRDWNKAVEHFRRAADLDPQNAQYVSVLRKAEYAARR